MFQFKLKKNSRIGITCNPRSASSDTRTLRMRAVTQLHVTQQQRRLAHKTAQHQKCIRLSG